VVTLFSNSYTTPSNHRHVRTFWTLNIGYKRSDRITYADRPSFHFHLFNLLFLPYSSTIGSVYTKNFPSLLTSFFYQRLVLESLTFSNTSLRTEISCEVEVPHFDESNVPELVPLTVFEIITAQLWVDRKLFESAICTGLLHLTVVFSSDQP